MFLPPSMAEAGVQGLKAHHRSHCLTDPRISTAFFLSSSLSIIPRPRDMVVSKAFFFWEVTKRRRMDCFFSFLLKLCRKKRGFFLRCI